MKPNRPGLQITIIAMLGICQLLGCKKDMAQKEFAKHGVQFIYPVSYSLSEHEGMVKIIELSGQQRQTVRLLVHESAEAEWLGSLTTQSFVRASTRQSDTNSIRSEFMSRDIGGRKRDGVAFEVIRPEGTTASEFFTISDGQRTLQVIVQYPKESTTNVMEEIIRLLDTIQLSPPTAADR